MVYLKDYKVPSFFVESLHLSFDLFDDGSFVESTALYYKNSKSNQKNANKLFKKWYLAKALKKIKPLAKKYASNLGVEYNQCKTSEMKYRWGSCTPKNNIIFNWRIVKAPMYVLEYLVAHELVHLIENNHTPEFWNILSIQVPNYEKAKKWLREKGQLLEIDF